MRNIRWLSFSALIAMLALSPMALAQPGPGKGGAAPEKRAQVELRLKELRNRLLRNNLGLDAAKAAQVEAVLDKYHGQRNQALGELAANRRTLKRLLDEDSSDQPAYAQALKGMQAARDRLHQIDRAQTAELGRVLTPKQQAKLNVAVRQLQRKLHRALRYGPPDGDRYMFEY